MVNRMWITLLTLWSCAGDKPGQDSDPHETSNPGDSGDTDTSPDSGDTDVTAENVPLDGYCADDVHYGNFLVDATARYAYVTGSVADGVVPITVLTGLETAGDCTLWRKENLFCDPSCDPGYTCNFDGECVPYPSGQALGTVTVDGLLEPVSMEPTVPGNTYFNTSLPNPPWTPGALVTLKSGGGAFDPFTLYGVAPDAFAMEDLAWQLTEGEALALSWTPPETTSRTRVRVSMNIDQHGTTPVSAVCWFDDDGAAEVPSAIIDGLIGYGVTGFPRATATRLSADTAEAGAGCVDLWLTSSLEPTIAVTGYTPCFTTDDCPDGQECNLELQRCE